MFFFLLSKVRCIDMSQRGHTQTLDSFVVAIKKPPPPIKKAGIKEFLLELIVDADLVHFVVFILFSSQVFDTPCCISPLVLLLCGPRIISLPCMLPMSQTH